MRNRAGRAELGSADILSAQRDAMAGGTPALPVGIEEV